MQEIVVYGAGGVGRQVAEIIHDINETGAHWHLLGYLDDDADTMAQAVCGVPVLGGLEWLVDHPCVQVALAVGDPTARLSLRARLEAAAEIRYATIVHPSAVLGSRCSVGAGSLIYAGAVVDPDVQIGDLVVINKICSIGHDSKIGNLATLAPGVHLGGAVHIGTGCDMGIGSAALPSVWIGDWSIVGAGAVVVGNLNPNVTAVGVPARVIKQRQSGWHLNSRSADAGAKK